MLAGLPVPADAVHELARLIRATGGDDLADQFERAVDDQVKLLALTLPERAVVLTALEDPPAELAELGAVLLAEWRVAHNLVHDLVLLSRLRAASDDIAYQACCELMDERGARLEALVTQIGKLEQTPDE